MYFPHFSKTIELFLLIILFSPVSLTIVSTEPERKPHPVWRSVCFLIPSLAFVLIFVFFGKHHKHYVSTVGRLCCLSCSNSSVIFFFPQPYLLRIINSLLVHFPNFTSNNLYRLCTHRPAVIFSSLKFTTLNCLI